MSARFEALDVMRLGGAVMVALFHYPAMASGFMPGRGYLAVDMFFMLSGFVVAATYGPSLERGGAGRFLVDRLARFWPLHAVGSVLGFVLAVAAVAMGRDYFGVVDPLASLTLALAFLPAATAMIFALNPPAWSLFFELVANAVYAMCAPFLSGRRLAAGVALLWIGFVSATLVHGSSSVGPEYPLYLGLLRVGFGFGAGVLLWRVRPLIRLPRWIAPPALVAVLIPPLLPFAWMGRWFDVAFFTLIVPLAIVANAVPMPRLAFATRWAALTFALYILHWPVLFAAAYVLRRLDAPAPVTTVALTGTLAAASVAGSWFGRASHRRILASTAYPWRRRDGDGFARVRTTRLMR